MRKYTNNYSEAALRSIPWASDDTNRAKYKEKIMQPSKPLKPIIVKPYQLKQIRTNPASLRALGLENKVIFMYVNLSDKPVRLDPKLD